MLEDTIVLTRLGARKRLAVACATLVLSSFPAAAETPAPDADRLVAAADDIRFPNSDFQVDITIESRHADDSPDVRKYRVLSKGKEDSVVLTIEPASERGQALLMKGRDLWVFLPRVSQPVRLSLAQRLTGQVANGDLARANFSGDYDAEYVRSESLRDEPAHVLDLKANGRGVTYARIQLWVSAQDGRPLRAEFYSVSGRLLKTCSYEDYRKLAGAVRPTRLVMEDALKQGEVSVLSYDDMIPKELPERLFTKDYLKKLQ